MDKAVTTNHPLAVRMAAISFLSVNLVIGSIFSSYGVLIAANETRMGITRDLSSLGIPLVLLSVALTAPVFGVLVTKVSIRLLMMIGGLLLAAGFVTVALTANPYIFLLAYALLIGPAMSLNMTMLPTTLVTRWYNVNRGRTLGIVNMPVLAAFVSPIIAVVLARYGLGTTYLMLAATGVLLVIIAWFVIDYPPSVADPTGEDLAKEAAADPGMSVGELLRTHRFWLASLAFSAIMTGAAVLAAHIVPLAQGWGVAVTKAATLLTFSSIGGMLGSVFWGWVAEWLGGAPVLAILSFGGAVLWLLLLVHPPYLALAIVAGLMGFTGAPVVPVASMALSQSLGRASFSRAFGLCNFVNLPFMALGVPAVAHVYVTTGSYSLAIVGLGAFFLLGGLCASYLTKSLADAQRRGRSLL